MYQKLTQYANLVLLSDAEAHPLVCMEALSAGLGLVLSPRCVAHLDIKKEFIEVIPFNKLDNITFVRNKIKENRQKSIKLRKEIREYSKNFDWDKIICGYTTIARNESVYINPEHMYYIPQSRPDSSFYQAKKIKRCKGHGGFGMGVTE